MFWSCIYFTLFFFYKLRGSWLCDKWCLMRSFEWRGEGICDQWEWLMIYCNEVWESCFLSICLWWQSRSDVFFFFICEHVELWQRWSDVAEPNRQDLNQLSTDLVIEGDWGGWSQNLHCGRGGRYWGSQSLINKLMKYSFLFVYLLNINK